MLNRIPRILVTLALVMVVCPGSIPAQELTFTETVDFALNQKVSLEAEAGLVEVRGVEFLQPAPKGGFGGAIKGTFSSGDEDLKATVVTRLELATTADTKWKVDFMIEFLDADGELIDRARGNASLKSEAKLLEIKHTTLKYAVAQITQARISAQGNGKL